MGGIMEKWNCHFSQIAEHFPQPAEVLADNTNLLPLKGKALDLASGLGGNALLLAKLGFDTTAIDISDVALTKLMNNAVKHRLKIDSKAINVITNPIPATFYDVICISHFLERTICHNIKEALKPQGLLFYQTWTEEKVDKTGPSNPEFLLKPNELLSLFSDLRVIYYREEGFNAKPDSAYRNKALLVAQKM